MDTVITMPLTPFDFCLRLNGFYWPFASVFFFPIWFIMIQEIFVKQVFRLQTFVKYALSHSFFFFNNNISRAFVACTSCRWFLITELASFCFNQNIARFYIDIYIYCWKKNLMTELIFIISTCKAVHTQVRKKIYKNRVFGVFFLK